MSLRKNTARFIVLLTLVSFMGNCIGYTRVNLLPDDPIPTDKVVVVHWHNYSYVLDNVSIDNHILEGTVTRQDWRFISKKRRVDAYIEKSLETPLENQAPCSIPVLASFLSLLPSVDEVSSVSGQ